MHEGQVVSSSAIPASAWGLCAEIYDPAAMAGCDPFSGRGIRLPVRSDIAVTVDDLEEIAQVTGIEHLVIFPGECAWADQGSDRQGAPPEEVQERWAAWLAAKGPPSLS
jgi:hypothetical protein